MCRVTHKHADEMTGTNLSSTSASSSSSSMSLGLPPLMDTCYPNAATHGDHLMSKQSSSSISMLNNPPYNNPQYYNLPPNPMNSTLSTGVAEMGGRHPGGGAGEIEGHHEGAITTPLGGGEVASKICKEEECSTQSLPTSSSTAISNEMRDIVAPEIGIDRSAFDELDELLSSAGSLGDSLGDMDNFWEW